MKRRSRDAAEPAVHRRRRLRWWLCTCGRRFPCGPYLARRDARSREIHPGGPAAETLTGWRIRRKDDR
jgi:hypothetical protein